MKKKTFSTMIKSFVISILILFAIIDIGLDIYRANKDYNEAVEQIKDNYILEQKQLLKQHVNAVVKLIDEESKKIKNLAKKKIKSKVYEAYNIALELYNNLKNHFKSNELQKIIIETIRKIRYNNGTGYFFITKLDGTELLFADKPYSEGKNILNIKDPDGKYVIQDMIKIAKEKGEGFYCYKWSKPGQIGKNFRKISFIKYFPPLNAFIGTGVYLDDLEEQQFQFIKKFLNNYRFGRKRNGYIFILKLLNINGGKNFAIMYVNPNRPDLIGKYLSDDYKDAKGKQFRKEFLKGLREKGECFVSYWYKKLKNKNPYPKLSYFKLTNDKRYIIAAGVYLDDIDKEISILKNELKKRIKKGIIFTSLTTFFILLIFILIFNKFNKYLQKEFEKFIILLKESLDKNKKIDNDKINFFEFYLFNKFIGNILEDKIKLLKELEGREKDYRALFEKSGIGMLIILDGKFIECNDIAVKLLGYNKKEELMVNVGELSPKYQPDGSESVKKAKQLVKTVLDTGNSISFQWMLKRKDGSTFWAIINLSPIPYKNKNAILVTWIDISELKQLENNLIKEKEQLTVTLLSIGDGVIATDIEKKVTLMNKAAEKLTGFTFEEAYGKNIEEIFQIFNEKTGKSGLNPVDTVLETGKRVELENHTILISKHGKKYNIADSASPIRDKESKIIGAILVFRDETEKIKMRKEILKMEKLKSISLLAGGIAHDFNNLLTGIYGNLELAILNADETVKKYIKRSLKSLDKAKGLTTQLLTFAKGGEPIIGSVDIGALIKQVTEFNTSGSNINVIYKIDKNIWNVKADKSQISQVISNLVINAKQAMPNGGTIYITVKNEHISKESKYGEVILDIGNYVKITIKDEGPGIPKEYLNRIFDPYFTTKSDGSGLGLSIVYSIIEKHNGIITVNSEQDKGTEFTIYIPADISGTLKNKKREKELSILPELKDKTVLIMDDEPEIRELGKEIFTYLGAKVEVVSSGEEAINKYKNKKFDFVIMDLTIKGGMGGAEAVKEILKIDKNAKIIVSSGYYSDPVMANYKEYGFKGVLFKPFTIEDVKKVIKSITETF